MKTTEAFCIWYGKLCVEHNSACRNDISTETVHSLEASISTRVVPEDINNVHFRHHLVTINVVLNTIYNVYWNEVVGIEGDCTIPAQSSITVTLQEKRFLKEMRQLYYLYVYPSTTTGKDFFSPF